MSILNISYYSKILLLLFKIVKLIEISNFIKFLLKIKIKYLLIIIKIIGFLNFKLKENFLFCLF
jgi:hypothetical protein